MQNIFNEFNLSNIKNLLEHRLMVNGECQLLQYDDQRPLSDLEESYQLINGLFSTLGPLIRGDSIFRILDFTDHIFSAF